MNREEFEQRCKEGGVETAKRLLRAYVDIDQPDCFVPELSSRGLCRVASNAITGEEFTFYADCKYGTELFHYMREIEND